jgi:hypothetical protein
MHHCVEGATVGPGNFTFRNARDVIRCADLPAGCAGVLSGHIHRHQVLTKDLAGTPLPAPVIYPGSLERTAFAEMGEEKGFMILKVQPGERGGEILDSSFIPLPHRTMAIRDLHPGNGKVTTWSSEGLRDALARAISDLPPDAVLRIQLHGLLPPSLRPLVGARSLRRLAPAEMNLEVRFPQEARGSPQGRGRERGRSADAARRPPGAPSSSAQIGLNLS